MANHTVKIGKRLIAPWKNMKNYLFIKQFTDNYVC